MYDDMAALFDRHKSDCAAMADAVSKLIAERAPAVAALMQTRAALSAEAQAAAQKRVDAAAAKRTEHVRNTMRVAIAQCASEPKLMDALRSLALLNTVPGT
jgi:glycyl-tRNA synthetase beta subunit